MSTMCLDAYFIDQDTRTITLLQSKSRTTENNFEEKSIDVSELLLMEVSRISKGEKTNSNGTPFSARAGPFSPVLRDRCLCARLVCRHGDPCPG